MLPEGARACHRPKLKTPPAQSSSGALNHDASASATIIPSGVGRIGPAPPRTSPDASSGAALRRTSPRRGASAGAWRAIAPRSIPSAERAPVTIRSAACSAAPIGSIAARAPTGSLK